MRARPAFLVLGFLLASRAGAASAQVVAPTPEGDVPPVSDAPMGMDSVQRGVQGPAGLFHARVLLHINTSKGAGAEPISLAPDLYYSVTDSLQFGLLHNLPMGWLTRPGAGLCLTGTDGGCPTVYNNVGFDAMYGLAFGDFHFSLQTSLYVLRAPDPAWFQLALGAKSKIHLGETVALFLNPQFGIALNQRDAMNPNKDQFYLPLELQFQVVPPVVFKLLTGVQGQLSAFGDTYQIPVGLGVIGNLSSALDLGLRFSFDNLLGKMAPGQGRTDLSSLSLMLRLRI